MTRVAVIGAGPSGLGQLRAFARARDAGAAIPEIVCFEKQADWGGLWAYTWRTGLDAHGEPVHSSMYRYLWSNGPKECLEFADYSFEAHFGQPIPSFPPRAVLHDYIVGRAAKSGIRDWIRFETAVRRVEAEGARFRVVSEHLPSRTQTSEIFDKVIVAAGHFSIPNVPEFEGVEQFPGRVLHAHDFRDALEFAGCRRDALDTCDQVRAALASGNCVEPWRSVCWRRSHECHRSRSEPHPGHPRTGPTEAAAAPDGPAPAAGGVAVRLPGHGPP